MSDHGKGFDVATFDPEEPDVLASGGRGLYLIAQLMDEMSLRLDGGLEVHMHKRGVPRCEVQPLESGPSDLRAAVEYDYRDTRLRAMLEEIGEAFIALDWEYRYVYFNRQASRISGLTDEALGRSCWDVHPELRDDPYGVRYREAMELGRPSIFERHSIISGAWLEVRVYPTRAGISVYYRDITERKRKERERNEYFEALQASEEKYRTIVETTSEGITIGAPDGTILFANQRLAEMLGYSVEELVGMSGRAITFEDEASDVQAARAELQAGQVQSRELRLRRKDGSGLIVQYSAAPLLDTEGRHVANVVMHRDVSEQRQAEKALRTSEARYRAMVETASEGIFVCQPDGSVSYVNQRMADMLGYAPEELIGKTGLELVFDDWRSAVLRARDGAGRGPAPPSEFLWRRKDGSELWTLFSATPLLDEAGTHIATFYMHSDITERRQAEDALRASEARYRELVEGANSAIVRWSADGTITFLNDYAQRLFGWSADEAVGQSVMILTPEQDSTGVDLRNLANEVLAHPESHRNVVNENVCRDGRRLWMTWTNSAILDEHGEVAEILAVGNDITEAKRTEQALRESEERFRLLHETMLQGVVYQEADGTIISMNPAAVQILGKAPEDFLGLSSVAVEHDTLREDGSPFPGTEHPAMVALRTGKPVPDVLMEVYNPRESRYRLISIQAMPLFRPGEDSPYRVYAVFDDVTERRQADERLRRQAQLLDLTSDAILTWELEGPIVYWNQGAVDLYGFAASDAVGQVSHDLLATAFPDGLSSLRAALLRDGDWTGELAHTTQDGRRIVVESRMRLASLDGRHVVLETNRDITERKRAEQALQDSRAELAATLDAITDGFYTLDHDWRVTYLNDKAAAIFPGGKDALGANFFELFPEAAGTKFETSKRQAMEHGEVCSYESYYPPFEAWFEERDYPRADGITVLFTDITERKRVEAALRESEEHHRSLFETLQESLLHALPAVEGLELAMRSLPARSLDLVGGDFCDVFKLPGGKVLAAIGDVAGKGIRAAALAETVHAAMRSFALIDDDPAFILRKTNDLLLADESEESYVTALVVVLDTVSGEARIASAGHPSPLRIGQGPCQLVEPLYGVPLGCFPAHYEPTTLLLDHGDALVLYTDGVTEARSDGELFGEELAMDTAWVMATAPVQDIADVLASAARSFSEELKDDLEVLVLRRS